MYNGLKVIDFHLHFPTQQGSFIEGGPNPRKDYAERVGERRAGIARELAMAYNRQWRATWGFDPPERESYSDEELADRWAAEVERYGLRAVGFVTGGGNKNLAKVIKRHPDKFVGFAHNYLFGEGAADEVKRAVTEDGMKAYKLLAPALDRPVEDEAGYPVWEMCAELDIPVLIHFGILGSGGGVAWHENINPLKLHNVAKDFPEVTFVVPHFGCAWIRETLQLCWACGNVCIDTSGSNQWVKWVDGEWDTKKLFRKYMETIGPERIIFGTDSSYFPRGLAASAPAGVGPDVVTLFYGWIPAFVDAGYLVPLPEDPFNEEFILETFSPMVANSKFEGSYWAIPTAVRALALFWNKDIFADAGLDPDSPPATLDEFVEAAIATTVYDGDMSDILSITRQGHAPALAAQDHHWFREVLIRQFGGAPYSDDGRTVTYNSEEGCAAFSWLAAFETEHVTGSNDILDGATNAFVNGESALHVDGSFRVGTIRNNNPDLNYGVTELPVGPNGEQHTFGSYWTHGITRRANDDPARLEAAVKFLQFITTPEAGTLWVNNVGELPAQATAAADPDIIADPILGAFSAGLAYSHATFFVDESAQRQVLIDAFDNIRLGGMDPCEALDEAAAAEQELIDEFWAGREM